MIDYFNGKYFEQNEDFHFEKMAWNNGFFTTLKVVNENIINLDLHLSRLKNSLLSNNLLFPNIDFEKIIERLISQNKLENARIKIMLFMFEGKINIWVKCLELSINSKEKVLKIYPQKQKRMKEFSFKSINYAKNIILNREAKENGFDDYLFIDDEDRILETTFCNIFFVNEREIVTPPSFLYVLPGTIREKLLSLGKCRNYRIVEREIFIKDIKNYRSVFITNAIHDLVSVKTIDYIDFDSSEEIIKILLAEI